MQNKISNFILQIWTWQITDRTCVKKVKKPPAQKLFSTPDIHAYIHIKNYFHFFSHID